MLDYAKKYEQQLMTKMMNIQGDERFMFADYGSYADFRFSLSDTSWTSVELVSLDKDGNIIGYIGCSHDRDANKHYGLKIINFYSFDETKQHYKLTFGRDLMEFFKRIIDRDDFRKIKYEVAIGNPIEPTYDKLTKKYGGRVVGIKEKDVKLLDGRYYDVKMYEIMKENLKVAFKEKDNG